MLGWGRAYNPLFDPEAAAIKGTHKVGEGERMSVPLNKIISPQATIYGRKARSIKGKVERGTFKSDSLPTLKKVGDKYVVHDGNHRLVGMLRAGKRRALALVQ